MCLETSWKKPKVTILPKVRYKVLIKTIDTYQTPYQEISIKPRLFSVFKADFLDQVYNGRIRHGIHTFKNKFAAICDIEDNGVVFKVIIPPFTKYYDGEYFNPNDSSCSKKIIFLRKVK